MRVPGRCIRLKNIGEGKIFELGFMPVVVRETDTHIFLGINKEDLNVGDQLRFEAEVFTK